MTPEKSAPFPRKDQRFEREPARRVFAQELRETRYQFKEGTEEKSPTFVLLPTGERCNRIFLVGTMTEKQRQGEQNIFYRARVVDPTGTTFIMAGNYQPEAMQQLAKIETPAFVAIIGKPSIYETPDGTKLISVKAESVTVVDKETRDLWILDAAAATLNRIDAYGTTPDSKTAQEQYTLDPVQFRSMVYNALTQMNI